MSEETIEPSVAQNDDGEVKVVDDVNGTNKNKLLEKLENLRKRRRQLILDVPEGKDLFGTTPQTVAKLVVECPKCGQQLGATRFALHYEKCLNKGSRARTNSTVTAPAKTATPELGEPWSAPCATCKGLETPESMLMCDGCSRVFHMWCLVPRMSEIPEGPWMCRKCLMRIVAPPGEETAALTPTKKNQQRLTAKDKVKKGRLPVGLEAVDFYCDLCNKQIMAEQSRFRCLTCGEFDTCSDCKAKGGLGHRSSHPMVEMRIS